MKPGDRVVICSHSQDGRSYIEGEAKLIKRHKDLWFVKFIGREAEGWRHFVSRDEFKAHLDKLKKKGRR